MSGLRANSAGNMVAGVYDSTGNFFSLESCEQIVTSDDAGRTLQIEAKLSASERWVQTFNYNGAITTISKWVRQ